MSDASTSKVVSGPQSAAIPRHVAIIMDGNGRWAQRRHLPRIAGHRAGVEAVRAVVRGCARRGVEVVTLFAFSSENWRRPPDEVGMLMDLFVSALQREAKRLHARQVRLRIIGDRERFGPKLREQIERAEALTRDNRGLNLNIAANYGGCWDITEAARRLAEQVARRQLLPADITPDTFQSRLSLHDLPDPDLFIRTGGEQRVSNFLLWQLAYTELYFTDTLWPDFRADAFDEALASFGRRQRRFGRTGDQVEQAGGA